MRYFSAKRSANGELEHNEFRSSSIVLKQFSVILTIFNVSFFILYKLLFLADIRETNHKTWTKHKRVWLKFLTNLVMAKFSGFFDRIQAWINVCV